MSFRGESSGGPSGGEGISPRQRRAFGCVTWVNMGMLAFLAANFLLSLPFRYVGDAEVYGYVPPRLAFLGLILILPGMALAAALGARTYRAPRRLAGRVGAGMGALIGWTSFFALAWLASVFGLEQRDQAFRTEVFPALAGSVAFYAFLPLALAATVLTMLALYSTTTSLERRRRQTLAGAALATLAGLGVVAASPDPIGIAGALVSSASAALGGWVGGIGYARAGGEEMMPPATAKSSLRE